MARRERKTRKNQTIMLPDGTRVQRRVTGFYNSGVLTTRYQLGLVKVNGVRYMVERTVAWDESNENAVPWNTTGEPTKCAPRSNGLTADDKQWLDDAVEALLRDEYGPRDEWRTWSHSMVPTLRGTTPTSLTWNLFGNFARWAVERKVGREAPAAIAEYWHGMDTGRERKAIAQQVSLSLRRLVTKGQAFTFYGESSRGREARVFAHIDYKED